MTTDRTVFTRQTLKFVVQADDDVFTEIDRWVNQIERIPSTPGDYTEHDLDGRNLHVAVLHQVAIAYWTDHAVREVRVVSIDRL